MNVATVKPWVRRQWSLWKHAAPLALTGVISAVCYVVGWLMSDVRSPGALVHAGALAAAFSVAATLYDYKAALKIGEDGAIERFARITGDLPLTGRQSQDQLEARLKGNSRRADKTISAAQVGLLFFATLVWGFADVAPSALPWAFRPAPAASATYGCDQSSTAAAPG